MKTIKSIINRSWVNTIIHNLVLISLFIFIDPSSLLAGPPTPPGVPLDSGVSLLVAAAIAYGTKAIKGDEEEKI